MSLRAQDLAFQRWYASKAFVIDYKVLQNIEKLWTGLQGPSEISWYVCEWELGSNAPNIQQSLCCKWRPFQLLALATENHFCPRRCCIWPVSTFFLFWLLLIGFTKILLCKRYMLWDFLGVSDPLSVIENLQGPLTQHVPSSFGYWIAWKSFCTAHSVLWIVCHESRSASQTQGVQWNQVQLRLYLLMAFLWTNSI